LCRARTAVLPEAMSVPELLRQMDQGAVRLRCPSGVARDLSLMAPTRDHCPRVSLIVAIYNAAATLRDCLDSVLQIEYPADDIQVLCVDNASSDETPRILQAYRNRVTILHEAERGPAAARNRGLAAATGDVIALTDADCIVDRHWLRHLVAQLHDPRIG